MNLQSFPPKRLRKNILPSKCIKSICEKDAVSHAHHSPSAMLVFFHVRYFNFNPWGINLSGSCHTVKITELIPMIELSTIVSAFVCLSNLVKRRPGFVAGDQDHPVFTVGGADSTFCGIEAIFFRGCD